MKWICLNQINDEDGKVLFKEQQTYAESDDRGETDNDDIAICLFNELGYRSYLYGEQVTENFNEITDITLNEREIKTAIVDYLKNTYNFISKTERVKIYCGEDGNIFSYIKSTKDILTQNNQ